MKDWVLVIDQGGQSTRVAVFDSNGNLITQDRSPCATEIIEVNEHQHYIEQNPKEILQGIQKSIQEIANQLGAQVNNIQFAGFSGQGSSLVCWDKQSGEPLSPVLSWQDTRGKAYLDSIQMTQQEVQRITGLRFSPHYGATKYRWCLDHLDAVKQAQKQNRLAIGPIVSYILWHLTDKRNRIDPGHAQRTLLWNIKTADWDKDLVDLFSIAENILPACCYHQDDFGELLINQHKIKFCVAARDQGASLFANGFPKSDICYINIGTGAFIQSVSQELLASENFLAEGLLISPLWITKNSRWFSREATVNGAAAAIPFMEKQTGLQITPDIIDQALSVNLGASDYFINAEGGIGAPFWRTDLTSHFSSALPALHQIAGWLESIIFLLHINFEKMNKGQLNLIQLSGGFSRSEKFCQRVADLFGLPVQVNENAEASLQGIAFLTAACPADWRVDQPAREFIATSNPLLHQRYHNWLTRLKALLETS